MKINHARLRVVVFVCLLLAWGIPASLVFATEREPSPEQGIEVAQEDESLLDEEIVVEVQDGSSALVLDEAEGEDAADAADAAKAESATKATEDPVPNAEQPAPFVSVRPYMQGEGWSKSWVKKGAVAGEPGKGLRLEALKLRLDRAGSLSGTIRCRAHVQSEGWQRWKKAGEVAGSKDKGRRIEALQIKLTSGVAKQYDVYYRVYVDSLGWMAWAANGQTAGTAGEGLRIEALQVQLVPKGAEAPQSVDQTTNVPFVGAEDVQVSAHVQNLGWSAYVSKGKVVGSASRGLRIEALKAVLVGSRVPGNIEVSAYLEGSGWSSWTTGGKTVGKTGVKQRLDAIKVRLTGEAAQVYDVYYRVYAKGVGWLAWAKNGALSGSTGLYLQIEALRVKLVAKGSKAPSNNNADWAKPAFKKMKVGYASKMSDEWQDQVWNGETSGTTGQGLPVQGLRMVLGGKDALLAGSILYSVHVNNGDWTEWVTDGCEVTSPSASKFIDAIQVQLAGTASQVYDVWYRVHAQSIGWMGWTRNGSSAGSIGAKRRVEAVEVRLVPKYKNKAPGSTTNSFQDWTISKSLDVAKSSRTISSFGGYIMSSKVSKDLKSAVDGIRGKGYDVGFIMMDISTHKGVCYNCDALFYGASSIKGPYIASVVSKHPEAIKKYAHNITEAMFYSWDYDYKEVLAAYGKGPMRTWCSECGVRKAIAESLPWANYTARELAKMWGRTYVLYQQSAAGEQLGKWSERPNISTIHATLGAEYRTRSKAGWIDAGGAKNPTINGGGPLWRVSDDGGIVYAKNGAYVVAIMSSVPADHDALNALTAAIDAAHSAM